MPTHSKFKDFRFFKNSFEAQFAKHASPAHNFKSWEVKTEALDKMIECIWNQFDHLRELHKEELEREIAQRIERRRARFNSACSVV